MRIELERFILSYALDGRLRRLETPVGEEASGPGLRAVFDQRSAAGGVRFRLDVHAPNPVEIVECRLEAVCPVDDPDRIFCNGFQSWTDSREFAPDEAMPGLRAAGRLARLHRFGDAHFHRYDGRPGLLHSHTFTLLRTTGDNVELAGSLSEAAGYTLFVFDTAPARMAITKECQGMRIQGRCRVFDLLFLSGPPGQVFDRYFGLMERSCTPGPPRSGWTSWYLHYTKISEAVILGNLNAFSSRGIPLDIFQIDDGFQRAVGDWLAIRPAFPRGMAPLVEEIHDAGYRAGLWLAPFVCEKRSDLFRNHPDWLLCDDAQKPVPAGWNPNWSGIFYALDPYSTGLREYLREVFAAVFDDWGFDMVKLDFLYAAAMVPRQGRTRGRIMCDAMDFLRQCAGDRLVLGCGVPLGAAFGRVEYCRIGADVAPTWEDRLLRWLRYRERVSTANCLTSTIGRSLLDGRAFGNDPDVFLLRSHDNRLNEDQRHTLFLLNNLFGSLVFTSDDISRYSPRQTALLRSMFPLTAKTLVRVNQDRDLLTVHLRIGPCRYRVLANLGEGARRADLPAGAYFERAQGFFAGGRKILLSPFASRCYLEIGERTPGVAGSSVHLFPGSEVGEITMEGNRIDIRLHERVCAGGTIWIRVPAPGRYTVNGAGVGSADVLPGVHAVAAEFQGPS